MWCFRVLFAQFGYFFFFGRIKAFLYSDGTRNAQAESLCGSGWTGKNATSSSERCRLTIRGGTKGTHARTYSISISPSAHLNLNNPGSTRRHGSSPHSSRSSSGTSSLRPSLDPSRRPSNPRLWTLPRTASTLRGSARSTRGWRRSSGATGRRS